MTRIGRNKFFKMAIGFLMTCVLVISLFAGIGAIWVNEETHEASADTDMLDASNKYVVPAGSAGSVNDATKGTASNPFTVLEIVPNHNMAQFGYLVGGQEPIDLLKFALSEDYDTYHDKLSEYMDIEPLTAEDATNVFNDHRVEGETYTLKKGAETETLTFGDSKILWVEDTGATTQYGQYEKVASGEVDNGLTALVEEKTDLIVGWTVVKQNPEDTEPIPERYIENELEEDDICAEYEEAERKIIGEPTDPTPVQYVKNENEYFVKVQPGTGLFSAAKYDYEGENKGTYSLEHRLVDKTKESGTLSIYDPTQVVYSTPNNITYDAAHGKYYATGGSNGFGTAGNYVVFILKATDGSEDDLPSYNAVGTGDIGKIYSEGNYNYNLKYNSFNVNEVAKTANYDFVKHEWAWRIVSKTEYNSFGGDKKEPRWEDTTDVNEFNNYTDGDTRKLDETITYEQFNAITDPNFKGNEEKDVTETRYNQLGNNYRRMEPEESTITQLTYDQWSGHGSDSNYYKEEGGRQLTWTERKDWSTDRYYNKAIESNITSPQRYIDLYNDPADYGFDYSRNEWVVISEDDYHRLGSYNTNVRKYEGSWWSGYTYYMRKVDALTYYEYKFFKKTITKPAKYFEITYKKYTYQLQKYEIYKVVQEHYFTCDYIYAGEGTGNACVVFKYAGKNGKYVVDVDKVVSGNVSQRANYPMAYDEDLTNTVPKDIQWVDDAAGDYTLVDATKYLVPQEVGTYQRKFGTHETVNLGEYSRTPLEEKTIVEEKEKNGVKTVIGERDYDRYVVVPVYSKDPTFTYRLKAYTSVLSGSIESNANLSLIALYKWTGEKYAQKAEDISQSFIDEHTLPTYMQDGAPAVAQMYTEESGTVIPVAIPYRFLDQQYSTAYLSSFTSNDLFKKSAIGLAYKNNTISAQNEELSSFTFLGWYTDAYGVNKFSDDTQIMGDTRIYAKWLGKYTDDTTGYSISFAANDSEDDRATNMPDTITGISKNSKIIAPDSVPMRNGYTFDGWYNGKGEKFKFDTVQMTDAIMDTEEDGEGHTVATKNLTLYAHWKAVGTKRYTFVFNPNERTLPLSVTIKQWVNNDGEGNPVYADYVSSSLANIADNGFGEFEVDSVKPYADGYTFDGWYMESECVNKFRFDSAGIEQISEAYPVSGDTVTYTLYAKWINNSRKPKYNVTFILNKPSAAVASPTFSSSVLSSSGITVNASGNYVKTSLEYGSIIPNFKDIKPSLTGNVEAKLDNYKVKVVTVTPDELKNTSSESFKLIGRADLIILNETCEDEIKELWNKHKKYTSLTAKKTSDDNYVTSFAQNDLSWDAVLEIMSRITGYKYVSGERKDIKTCPVLFDYNIYDNCLTEGSEGYQEIGIVAKDKKNKDITISEEPSNKANIFKLYLMTQSASPITIYNAYVSGKQTSISNEIKTNADGKAILVKRGTTSTPFATDSSSDANLFWNRYTLVPFSALSKSDWTENRLNALKSIGFTEGVSLNTILGTSRIKNRLFIYNNIEGDSKKDINLISGFTQPVALETSSFNDVKGLLNDPAGTNYKTSDVFYYMLHGTTQYENLARDIRILEIEPGTEFHTDEYWFWYISHYVPNVTGTITGKGMSSLEFQCNIEDLNSTYDVIFMGTNKTRKTLDEANGIDDSSLNKIEPYTNTQWTERKYDHEGNIATLINTIKSDIGRDHSSTAIWKLKEHYTIGSKVYDWYYGEDKGSNEYGTVLVVNQSDYNHGAVINEWNDDRDRTGDAGTYSFRYDSNYIYIRLCDTECEGYYSGHGMGRKWHETKPTVYKYYAIAYATEKEIVHKETYYTYYHTGNISTTSQYAVGSFSSLKVNSDGTVEPKAKTIGSTTNVNDDLTVKAAFSGNDFTFTKYKAVAEFIKAKYPIIFDDGFFISSTDDSINTLLIDPATWIYKLLDELVTDSPNREDNRNWFRLNTIDDTGIEAFRSSLMNKTFKLEVKKAPIAYQDKSKLTGSVAEKDRKVYINGADPNNRDLEFEIRINEIGTGGKYKLKLFIDTNGDGKYSTETERIDTITVKEINSEHSTIPFNADEAYLDGNKLYKVTRTLPEDQAGVLAWKLQVTEVKGGKETTVRDDVTGLSAIKVAERTRINVLQVVSTSNNKDHSYLYNNKNGTEV
nr:DUF5057 domain-containing protein [Eubacterium sp.]